MSGNGSSTNVMVDGSPPAFSTTLLTVVVLMFFSVLTATRLPARSFADRIGLSPLTMTAPKSPPSAPVDATPAATAFSGRPCELASSSDVVLLNPNWYWPLMTLGTIAAPPCAVSSVTSRPSAEKKPCLMPR